MRKIGARDPLDNMELFGVNGPVRHLFVEANGVHHQRVAFPLAYGVTLPRRIEDLGMRPSVEKDLPEPWRRLLADVNDLRGRLDQLEDVVPVGLRSRQTD